MNNLNKLKTKIAELVPEVKENIGPVDCIKALENDDSLTYTIGLTVFGLWSIGKPLSEQSEECLEFLSEILL